MLRENAILDLELSCGKWSAEEQKEVLDKLKRLNEEIDPDVYDYED